MLTDKELNDMIELSSTDDWEYISCDNQREALQELKERRESDLKPAGRFTNNDIYTFGDQQKSIESEYLEVCKAFNYWYIVDSCAETKNHFCEELIDLQISCETMLAKIGLNEQQRREARKKVIAKNAARGYYKEDDTP
jgi:hypothetical protein